MHARLVAVALAIAFAAPATAGVNYGEHGSWITTITADDYVVTLTGPASSEVVCFGYVVDPADATDPSDRAWFFHVAEDGTCAGESVDEDVSFQITAFGGTKTMTWMDAGDTAYVGEAFDAVKEISTSGGGQDWMCYLESDAQPGFSLGDPVFIDTEEFDTPASGGTLSVDDVRLSKVASAQNAPFTVDVGVVRVTDDDYELAIDATNDASIVPNSDALTCSTFDVRMAQLGKTYNNDNEDVFYLEAANAWFGETFGESRVVSGLLRLTPGSGVTAGVKVEDGHHEHRAHLADVDSSAAVAHTGPCAGTCEISLVRDSTLHSTTPEIQAQKLWLHFEDPDTTDDHVLMHDIAIKTSTTAAAANAGKLVTTVALGANEGLVLEKWSLEDMAYFIDKDADGDFDTGEPVYIKHPENGEDGDLTNGGACTAGATERCLEVHDIRVVVPGKTGGSLVESTSAADYLDYKLLKGKPLFTVKAFNDEYDNRQPLQTVTAKFDDDGDGIWEAGESVILTSATTAADGQHRVWDGATTAAVDNTLTCPGDPECGNTLTTAYVKVTGPDTTWDDTDSEYLYWSSDAFLGPGDFRIHAPGALAEGPSTAVASANADIGFNPMAAGASEIYLSTGSGIFPAVNDIMIYPTFGDRLTSSDSQVVPTVVELADVDLVQFNQDDSNAPSQRVHYFDFSDSSGEPDHTEEHMLRLSSFGSKAAGTFLTSSDDDETDGPLVTIEDDAELWVGFVETAIGSGSLDETDIFAVDMPSAWGGGTQGDYTRQDVRLSKTTYSGSTYKAGAFLLASHTDFVFNGYSLDQDAAILWWDADLNGEVTSADNLWIRDGAVATPDYPGLFDLRLGGSGGATGDGTVGTSTSTSTTTSTTTTSTSTSTTSTSITVTTTDSASSNTGASSSSGGTSTSDEGGTETDDPEQPVPAPIAVVLVAIGAALLAIRRRL